MIHDIFHDVTQIRYGGLEARHCPAPVKPIKVRLVDLRCIKGTVKYLDPVMEDHGISWNIWIQSYLDLIITYIFGSKD
jgi:hypothetical protein